MMKTRSTKSIRARTPTRDKESPRKRAKTTKTQAKATATNAVVARGRVDAVPPFHQKVDRVATPRPKSGVRTHTSSSHPPRINVLSHTKYKSTPRVDPFAAVREAAVELRPKTPKSNHKNNYLTRMYGGKDGSMALALLAMQAEKMANLSPTPKYVTGGIPRSGQSLTTTALVGTVKGVTMHSVMKQPIISTPTATPEATTLIRNGTRGGHRKSPAAIRLESASTVNTAVQKQSRELKHSSATMEIKAAAAATQVVLRDVANTETLHGPKTSEEQQRAGTPTMVEEGLVTDAVQAVNAGTTVLGGNAGTNPPSLYEDCVDLWNAYLLETSNQIAGYELHEDNTFEPIPFHVLAGGTSIEADSDDTNAAMLEKDALKVSGAIDSHGKCLPALNTRKPSTLVELGNTFGLTKSKAKRDVEVVGPKSWQMSVIHRMVVYLEETKDCEHAHFVPNIRTAIAKCFAHHSRGTPKYNHLPGAIFEDLVTIMGGQAFLATFKAAKMFHHARLDDTNDSFYFGGEMNDFQAATMTTADVTALIQVAVGYGYHMARTVVPANSVDTTSIHSLVEQGARSVLAMNDVGRQAFYKKHITPHSSIDKP